MYFIFGVFQNPAPQHMYVRGWLFHFVPTRTLIGRVEAAKIWRGRNQSHLQMSKIESRTISVHFYAQFQKCSHKTFVRTAQNFCTNNCAHKKCYPSSGPSFEALEYFHEMKHTPMWSRYFHLPNGKMFFVWNYFLLSKEAPSFLLWSLLLAKVKIKSYLPYLP